MPLMKKNSLTSTTYTDNLLLCVNTPPHQNDEIKKRHLRGQESLI